MIMEEIAAGKLDYLNQKFENVQFSSNYVWCENSLQAYVELTTYLIVGSSLTRRPFLAVLQFSVIYAIVQHYNTAYFLKYVYL